MIKNLPVFVLVAGFPVRSQSVVDSFILNWIFANHEAIEAKLSMKSDWRELPDKKACRIIASRPGDIMVAEQSAELATWMVTTADHFAQVFPQYL